MWSGIVFISIAGALWGLTLATPKLVPAFSPLEITLGRYFFLGLACLSVVFLMKKDVFKKLSLKLWGIAFLYAFISNVGYYIILVIGIRFAGPSVATLIIGILPIAIAVYGNIYKREFPFSILMFPIACIFIGLFIVNTMEFKWQGGITVEAIIGILCCLAALFAWTWYGVSNANLLKSTKELETSTWTFVVGLATLTQVILIMMGYFMADGMASSFVDRMSSNQGAHFIMISLLLGLGSSFAAVWLWNKGSKVIPVSLAGQLLCMETISALLYTYIFEQRVPSLLMFIGMLLCVAGAVIGMRRINAYSCRHQKLLA